MKKNSERIIALAGIYQASALVSNIAHTGTVDMNAFESSIYSLFQIEAVDTLAVFDGIAGIQYGLERIIEQFTHTDKKQIETTRYTLQLIHLQKKLNKKPDLISLIIEGLETAKDRQQHFDMLHNNIIAQLADIYAETISNLQPKVMVVGDPTYLQNNINAERIRALLLAGIRSSMLWHQKGGSRWQLLLQRNSLVSDCEYLLNQI